MVDTVAEDTALPAASRVETKRRLNLRWLVAVIVLGLLAASGWIVWRTGLTLPAEPVTTPVTSFGGLAFGPRLSPNGALVTYQWDGRRNESDAPNWDIYVQAVEGGEPHRVTSSAAPEFCPVWSPDGQKIAFVRTIRDGVFSIQVIPYPEGTETTINPPDLLTDGCSIDWSPDGHSLALTVKSNNSMRRVVALLSFDTGNVKPLTSPPTDASADFDPRFSPDGKTIAFLRNPTTAGPYGDIYTVPTMGGSERRMTSGARGIAGHDWTPDGKELVFSSNRGGYWTLWRVRTDRPMTEPQVVPGIGTDAYFPSIARENYRLVYHEFRQDLDIWRVPMSPGQDGSQPGLGTSTPVRGSTRKDVSPQISPDGGRLVFVSVRDGDQAIWVSATDGLNPLRIAGFQGYPAGSPRWSPTGTRIAFDAAVAGPTQIFLVPSHGGSRPTPLTTGPAENVVPSWSPDEKWIYFASNRTGRDEVWRVPSIGGTATQVTHGGGFAPFESADAKFLYYVKGLDVRGIWRVPVDGGDETPVLDGPVSGFWGYWALLPHGIVFAIQDQNGRAPALVNYFNFSSKQTTTLGHLDSPAIRGYPFFAVSPDEKTIFYGKRKQGDRSDIMLVKNFR